MNLCAYRKLYEEYPEKYGTIKAAIGFGIGEVRVSRFFLPDFWLIFVPPDTLEKSRGRCSIRICKNGGRFLVGVKNRTFSKVQKKSLISVAIARLGSNILIRLLSVAFQANHHF